MKDKEKQIEEMANLMTGCVNCRAFGECFSKCSSFISNGIKATILLREGYRQIPKDSVVLSKEEYERLKTDSLTKSRLTMADRLMIGYKARKGTADQLFTYMDMNNLLEISKTELKAFFEIQYLLKK